MVYEIGGVERMLSVQFAENLAGLKVRPYALWELSLKRNAQVRQPGELVRVWEKTCAEASMEFCKADKGNRWVSVKKFV